MTTVSEAVFACYSKVCAPPPAGKGGSSKAGSVRHRNRNNPVAGPNASEAERHAAYVKEMLANRKNTTVNRDGTIAVTVGGGKLAKFRERDGKSDKWRADKKATKWSQDQSKAAMKTPAAQMVAGKSDGVKFASHPKMTVEKLRDRIVAQKKYIRDEAPKGSIPFEKGYLAGMETALKDRWPGDGYSNKFLSGQS